MVTTDSGVREHGQRRSDRVLGPGYLAGLDSLSFDQVRVLRAEAEQVEADISYLRRLVQGRMDVLRVELAQGADVSLHRLAGALAGPPVGAASGQGHRFGAAEPTLVPQRRRDIEVLLQEADLTDVSVATGLELRLALTVLEREEAQLSAQRLAVHSVVDTLRRQVVERHRATLRSEAVHLGA